MKKNTWQTAGLVMALFGAAYAAEAQGQRPSKEEILAKYDADGDGQLSETERATMREEMGNRGGRGGQRGGQGGGQRMSREDLIAKYDTDGDGKLSETEREAARAEMGGRGGRGGQRGGQNETAAMVAKYDLDGNGELSATELQQLLEDQKNQPAPEEAGGERGPRGQGGQSEQGQGRRGQRMSREEVMAKYDADGDGKLSEEERATMRADMKKNRAQN